MPFVAAVFKHGQAVVPPGAGQENAAVGNVRFPGEGAVLKEEALLLLQSVGGGSREAAGPSVKDRADLAVPEQSPAAAEDKVHGALDPAAEEALGKQPVHPQLGRQQVHIAQDQILGQGTHKEGVLGGAENAILHQEIVSVDAESHLLALLPGREGVVFHREAAHGHAVRADGQGPGAKGIVFPPVGMELLGVVVIDQPRLLRPGAEEAETRRSDLQLLPVYPRPELYDRSRGKHIQNVLKRTFGAYSDFCSHPLGFSLKKLNRLASLL